MRIANRWQAAGVQLAASTLLSLCVLAVMLALWYPDPLFRAAGADRLFLLIAAANFALGPLLIFLVFKPGKAGLKLDLAVLTCVQLGAFAYGCYIAYASRPAFIVFVKDRFEMAGAAELDPAELAAARFPQFRQAPLNGPLLAFADFDVSVEDRQKLVTAALAGLDMQNFPRYWVPYAGRRNEVLAKALAPGKLREVDAQTAKVVDAWLAASGTKESDVRYLALRARRAWVAVLIDPKTAQPVKMLLAEKI